MWLGSVKHPMPLGPEAFSLCILTCEMPQLGKYMNFKNFWLDPCMLWELGKGDRIIWSLMPWFGNLAINHPDDFFNFLCPFFFFGSRYSGFCIQKQLVFSFNYNTSNYVHGNLLVLLGTIIIHTFTVILYNVACDALNLKLVDGLIFSLTSVFCWKECKSLYKRKGQIAFY